MNDQNASEIDFPTTETGVSPEVNAAPTVAAATVAQVTSEYRQALEDLEMWPRTECIWERAQEARKAYEGPDRAQLDLKLVELKANERNHVNAALEAWADNVQDPQRKSNVLGRMYVYEKCHGYDPFLHAKFMELQGREEETGAQ